MSTESNPPSGLEAKPVSAPSPIHRRLLETLRLADLVEPARANEPLTRSDLERVARAANPHAAATLADLRREAVSGLVVTYPVTLRVRVPGLPVPHEDRTLVSHVVDAIAAIPATEMQMVGQLPAELPLAHALELVRTLVSARPDVPLRAFTADDVARVAHRERMPYAQTLAALRDAGLATLDWRPGADASGGADRVHRAAHETGMKTFAPVTYGRDGEPFLDRIDRIRAIAETTKGYVSAVLVPERSEGASPLSGTAGTDDWLACALVRLALGHVVPHVTVDAHLLGHKLGAAMLNAGADDLVGAQAAAAWAPPTDDGPRPLNPARMTKYVIEARRSPAARDGIFRPLPGEASAARDG